jgi:hypothetical protein
MDIASCRGLSVTARRDPITLTPKGENRIIGALFLWRNFARKRPRILARTPVLYFSA